MDNFCRTAGDGMEYVPSTSDPNVDNSPRRVTKEEPSQTTRPRLVEIIPTNSLLINKSNVNKKSTKFVPYEPYTAAVKPIVPYNKSGIKKNRNNMDINILINQLSMVDREQSEFKPRTKTISQCDKEKPNTKVCSNECKEMQAKIDALTKENVSIKEQLNQQAQINKELKTMLVASMGEDLETQVQSLNEDKKYLSNALLSSAHHLSTHQEQTEWLAGQCEVWRSKFLASSLMVEELAAWKRVLSKRNEEVENVVHELIEERKRVREMLITTYRNLYCLYEEWLSKLAINDQDYTRPIGNLNLSVSKPQSSNILDLSIANMKMSANISDQYDKCDVNYLNTMNMCTDAEVHAQKVISTPLEVLKDNEVPLHAVVNHAFKKSNTETPQIAACSHCNGKIQLL